MDFFSSHVLTELQEMDMSVRPMVKATSIKFVSIFRNQFTKEQIGALLPLLIAHLGSTSVVVHTYAAAGELCCCVMPLVMCYDGLDVMFTLVLYSLYSHALPKNYSH